MKNQILLPNRFKWIGLVMFLPFLALSIASIFYEINLPFLHFQTESPDNSWTLGNENLTDEFASCGLILSLIFMGFARERREDEYVNSIRLQSFQLAIIINYLLMMIMIFTVYGSIFLAMLYIYVPLQLVVFLIIFYSRLKVIPYFAKTRIA